MEGRKSFHLARICGVVLIAAVLLLLVDQAAKNMVLENLRNTSSLSLIPGLLELTYVENTGAAFGMFKGNIWVVYAVSAVAYAVILVGLFRYQKHTFFSYSACALLLAGGVGNLIDRHNYGFVVDFIHVMFFDYVFNFADCCITVACVFLVIHVLVLSYREKKEKEALHSRENGQL